MVRWEYHALDLADLPGRVNEVEMLNKAGEDGWELIAIVANHVAYLRRQVDEPDAPDDRSTRRRRQSVG
jgi:hypothetical protein